MRLVAVFITVIILLSFLQCNSDGLKAVADPEGVQGVRSKPPPRPPFLNVL